MATTTNGYTTNGNRKVTFEANIPQTITLKFTGGKTVQSQFGGDQVLYTCEEGALYASPALAQLIDKIGGCGDTLRVTKRQRRIGNTTHTDWHVERVSPPVDDPFPAEDDYGELARAKEQSARQAAAEAAAAAARIARPEAAATIDAPASAPHPNVLAQALMLAIDAAIVAQTHAHKHGLTIAWRSEDIRAMAATLLIDSRDRRNTK